MIDPTQPFNRPPRRQLPALETIDMDLPTLADAPTHAEFHWVLVVSPLLGFFAMALFYVARGGLSSPLAVLPLGLLALVSVASTVLLTRWRAGSARKTFMTQRRTHERALDARRTRLQALHLAVQATMDALYPPPAALLSQALDPDASLWERRPDDLDFLTLRVGTGRVTAPIKWRVSADDADSDPVTAAVIARYRALEAAALTVSLREITSLAVVGRRPQALSLAYALVAQAALAHSPQELHMAVIAPPGSVADWDWAAWLPHTQQIEQLPLAFSSETTRRVLGYLGQWIDSRREMGSTQPHLLLIVDEPQWLETDAAFHDLLRLGERVGASVLCVAGSYESVPGDCAALLTIAPDNSFRYRVGSLETQGTVADSLSLADMRLAARGLAAITIADASSTSQIPPQVDLLELYGVRTTAELARQLPQRWTRGSGQLPRPVPIGRESLLNETFLMLDEEHHGPHGMLAGTTGAGKSELLQSLVCGLAIEHDPRDLTLLLIDFKGGSTFNLFRQLPHTVGLVTNLEPNEVRRVLEALKSELEQRQQFLKASNARDIYQYYRYHADDPTRALPHLVIVVDEFTQLAREMPDFLSELVKTAQIGRSLGLHLILGTQSPMDVITDEMNANLQFRICLRVQSADASRVMLRRPDAAYIPVGRPGRGFLQVGERGLFRQFQAAYSGGQYTGSAPRDAQPTLELKRANGETLRLIGTKTADIADPYSVAHAVVEMVAQVAKQRRIEPAKPLLLPTLPRQARLSDVHSNVRGGWDGYRWLPAHTFEGQGVPVGSAPIGLVDDLVGRSQQALWIHLNRDGGDQGSDGHLLVVGAPATGKTTLLRTLALSLAALHPPTALHLYFLSFTGSGLNTVSRLPHAEQVVSGTQTERVRRLFGRLIGALETRLTQGAEGAPHLVLFLDQYEQFRDSYRDVHSADLERLINEGRAVNIFVVLTLSTIHALPDRLRAVMQQRIALHQANSSDYVLVVGRIQSPDSRGLPVGRGYINSPQQPLLAQVFLPVMNPTSALDDLHVNEALIAAVDALNSAYTRGGVRSQAPLPLSELPAYVRYDMLPTATSTGLVTALGLRDDDSLSAFALDWRDDGTHFVVAGPPASGKTNLLQLAVLRAAEGVAPSGLGMVLVDFNQRSLRSVEPLKQVLTRVTDLGELSDMLTKLEAHLALLQPLGENAPATVLVIDDYDLFADAISLDPAIANRLRHLVRFYGDLAFHVWVSGTFERAGDPFIKQLLLRRSGFGLMQRDMLQRLNLRTAHLPADTMPVGRAFVPRIGGVDIVQTALVEDAAALVGRLNDDVWSHEEAALWYGTPAQTSVVPPPARSAAMLEQTDIDTAGLIDDLLNDLRGKP